jgi:hypothetical protein
VRKKLQCGILIIIFDDKSPRGWQKSIVVQNTHFKIIKITPHSLHFEDVGDGVGEVTPQLFEGIGMVKWFFLINLIILNGYINFVYGVMA